MAKELKITKFEGTNNPKSDVSKGSDGFSQLHNASFVDGDTTNIVKRKGVKSEYSTKHGDVRGFLRTDIKSYTTDNKREINTSASGDIKMASPMFEFDHDSNDNSEFKVDFYQGKVTNPVGDTANNVDHTDGTGANPIKIVDYNHKSKENIDNIHKIFRGGDFYLSRTETFNEYKGKSTKRTVEVEVPDLIYKDGKLEFADANYKVDWTAKLKTQLYDWSKEPSITTDMFLNMVAPKISMGKLSFMVRIGGLHNVPARQKFLAVEDKVSFLGGTSLNSKIDASSVSAYDGYRHELSSTPAFKNITWERDSTFDVNTLPWTKITSTETKPFNRKTFMSLTLFPNKGGSGQTYANIEIDTSAMFTEHRLWNSKGKLNTNNEQDFIDDVIDSFKVTLELPLLGILIAEHKETLSLPDDMSFGINQVTRNKAGWKHGKDEDSIQNVFYQAGRINGGVTWYPIITDLNKHPVTKYHYGGSSKYLEATQSETPDPISPPSDTPKTIITLEFNYVLKQELWTKGKTPYFNFILDVTKSRPNGASLYKVAMDKPSQFSGLVIYGSNDNGISWTNLMDDNKILSQHSLEQELKPNAKAYKRFLFQFSTGTGGFLTNDFSIHNLRLYETIKTDSFSTKVITQQLKVPITLPDVSSPTDEVDVLISDNGIHIYEGAKLSTSFPISGAKTIGHTDLKSTAIKFNNDIYVATGIRFVRLRRVVNKFKDASGVTQSQSIWVMDYMDQENYQPDENEIPLYGYNILSTTPKTITIDPNQITEPEIRLTTKEHIVRTGDEIKVNAITAVPSGMTVTPSPGLPTWKKTKPDGSSLNDTASSFTTLLADKPGDYIFTATWDVGGRHYIKSITITVQNRVTVDTEAKSITGRINACRGLKVVNTSLLLFNNGTSEIYASFPNNPGYFLESMKLDANLSGKNEPVLDIMTYNTVQLVFTNTTTVGLVGQGLPPSIFDLVAGQTAQFEVNSNNSNIESGIFRMFMLDNTVGIANDRAACEMKNSVAFHNKDGVWIVEDAQVSAKRLKIASLSGMNSEVIRKHPNWDRSHIFWDDHKIFLSLYKDSIVYVFDVAALGACTTWGSDLMRPSLSCQYHDKTFCLTNEEDKEYVFQMPEKLSKETYLKNDMNDFTDDGEIYKFNITIKRLFINTLLSKKVIKRSTAAIQHGTLFDKEEEYVYFHNQINDGEDVTLVAKLKTLKPQDDNGWDMFGVGIDPTKQKNYTTMMRANRLSNAPTYEIENNQDVPIVVHDVSLLIQELKTRR